MGKKISIEAQGKAYDAAAERDANIIGQKIAEARKRLGMSQPIFIERLSKLGLKIGRAAESQWETGRTVPNAYQLLAICAALEIEDGTRYFTRDYFPVLNAEGERRLSEYKSDLIASGRYSPILKSADIIEYRDMPVSSLAASAGTGELLDGDSFEYLSFPENSIPKNADFGIRICGDSMEPVYHDGQIVWVQSCEKIAVGEVGIFVYDGEGYIKCYAEGEPPEELKPEFTDSYGVLHPQPLLISYNKSYAPRPVLPDRGFRTVGRVL